MNLELIRKTLFTLGYSYGPGTVVNFFHALSQKYINVTHGLEIRFQKKM